MSSGGNAFAKYDTGQWKSRATIRLTGCIYTHHWEKSHQAVFGSADFVVASVVIGNASHQVAAGFLFVFSSHHVSVRCTLGKKKTIGRSTRL